MDGGASRDGSGHGICKKRPRRGSSLPYESSSTIEIDASGAIRGRVLVSDQGQEALDGAVVAAPTPAVVPPEGDGRDANRAVDTFLTVSSPPICSTSAAITQMVTTHDDTSMLPSVVEMLANSGRLTDDNLIIVRMDSEGIVKEWNDTAAAVMGWTREDTHEKPLISNFVIPELQPMVQHIFEEGIRGHQTKFVMEVKTKYDETRFLLVDTSPIGDPSDGGDGIVGLVGQARDVTREAMYDLAVRAMDADNKMLIKTANAPIFGVDVHMKVNEWNECCIASTGFVSGDVLGRPFVESLIAQPKREAVRDVLDRALRTCEQTNNCELEVLTKSGGECRIWIVNVTPRLDPNGVAFGAIAVAKDVTDDRRLADQLRQMEISNRAQEDMLDSERGMTAYFAHELRNPLGAIDSALKLLPPNEMSDSTKSLVDAMQLCTEFMSSVMNNLLDVRKMEEGKMELKKEAMSISRLLTDVHGMLGPSVTEGVEFCVDCQTEGRDWVLGDSHRIHQVLTNVVTNSIKYTTSGFITLRAAWEDNAIRFDCVDTGPGIPKNEQERIFEKFVQRGGAPGTGLGLAIAKNVVDIYGGSIGFESDPAQKPGTTCIIVLPLEACDPAFDKHEEEPPANKISDALSFLVIDDIPVNRTLLSRRLIEGVAPNASVQEARNGEEALDLCKRETFDVILVDQYMPEAGGVMVGSDVVAELRRIGTDAIIVGCSGSDSNVAFQDAGCDLVWGKPMPPNVVVIKQLSELLSPEKKPKGMTTGDCL